MNVQIEKKLKQNTLYMYFHKSFETILLSYNSNFMFIHRSYRLAKSCPRISRRDEQSRRLALKQK